jgi:hypothetical protein
MSRSFRDLVEALKAKEEKSELKPRAKGEEDFAADQGYPPKIGGPNDRPYPEKGSDDVVNARKAKKTNMHDNPVPGNETGKQPMQGSSKAPELKTYREIIAGLKQTDGGRGYQLDNGDKKIVRTSPSAVHGVDLDEAAATRKHFRAAAKMISDMKGTVPDEHRHMVALKHAEMYKSMNPRFDKEKFFNACNLSESALGLAAAAAVGGYAVHAWNHGGKQLKARDAAHKKLVNSMLDRNTQSHEAIGDNKHRITYNDGRVATVHTDSHGVSRIRTKGADGKVTNSKVRHDLNKLVKAGVGQNQIDEAVHDQLVTIAETSKPAMVRFQNGETATVNPQTAHKMLETVSRLNASNARRFNESINKSPADFLKMMQFSEKH